MKQLKAAVELDCAPMGTFEGYIPDDVSPIPPDDESMTTLESYPDDESPLKWLDSPEKRTFCEARQGNGRRIFYDNQGDDDSESPTNPKNANIDLESSVIILKLPEATPEKDIILNQIHGDCSCRYFDVRSRQRWITLAASSSTINGSGEDGIAENGNLNRTTTATFCFLSAGITGLVTFVTMYYATTQ